MAKLQRNNTNYTKK